MRKLKLAAVALLGVAALGLSACATGLNTQVSRHQAAQIPLGQTFYVVPAQGAPTNEFYRYASMVSQQLQAQGYRSAGAPQVADMLVRLDYGVDEGKTEYVGADPFYDSRFGGGLGYGFGSGWRNPYFDPFWGVYYGRPYWSRWSSHPYYYGWNDPFWYGSGYGSYGPGAIRDYTVYKSYLDLDIVRRVDNAPLFEGHAKARSQTDELDALVPNLIQAMFTGFPGKNGETVKITVPAKR
jgi:hypothetical protein